MEKPTRIALAVVLPVIVIGLVVSVFLSDTKRTQFEIVSYNGVLGYDLDSDWNAVYNYTVYVKVKNVLGTSTSITVYCELTREDLTTITKHEIIPLNKGESETIKFFFSNQDLKGASPHQYKIYGE